MFHLRPLPLRFLYAFLLALAATLWLPLCAAAQLSQNSGIRSTDTWVTFDLTTQIQAPSSLISRPTITHTYHVEIGYDISGQVVLNLWPTGDSGVPSDWGEISVIRLSGGNVTVFDQEGVPIPWVAPVANIPDFNPLSLLGSNPGSSILSQLVVSNIQTQAQKTNSQLSYNGSYAVLTSEPSGTPQWTYAPSGNVYVATQFTFSINQPNLTATNTLQFSNVQWFQNSANDIARANQGSTAISPPPATTSTPPSVTESSESGCVPYLSNLGGTQNVVFQHGIFSSGCTWYRMVPWLNQDFRWGIELVPSLNASDNLVNQGNDLVSRINAVGGDNYILVGHSQGGLVSRFAAQHFQNLTPPPLIPVTKGVLTLDTPHRGAPIAAIPQGLVNDVLQGDMFGLWNAVRCNLPINNILCYLIALQYQGMASMSTGLFVNLGALSDLVPGSPFLTNLNNQPESFQKAAVIGNTPRRWIEVRIAGNFIFRGCEPEDACGERNLARIYGIIHNSVVASWAIAELVCVWTWNPYACALADYLLEIWIWMNIADFDYNFITAGLQPQDGLVPSASQNYPSSFALQYPINGADSHSRSIRSDLARNALRQALAGPQFLVPTQASCTFSASPSSSSYSSSGGSGTFVLGTGAGCQWSAVSQVPWISITSGASGTSVGNVSFSVAANTVPWPRTGSIVLGSGSSSATFTVKQAGVCTYSLSYYTYAIPPSGGSATVNVYTQNGCVWSAVSNASWLTIASGASGTGPGSFTFTATANTGSTSLIGAISVVSQSLTVVLGDPQGTPGTGSVTIQGTPRFTWVCGPDCPHCMRSCSTLVYNSGTVTITVGGNSFSAEYSGTKSASQIAADLASQINLSSLVSATVSGATITVTSRVSGSHTNYTLSTSYTFDTENFTSPAFTAIASGPTLTGGSD